MLKEWLVRRRDNPYPSREEKKSLAIKTGLTYIQICNWFANWRRKLKNAGDERHKRTWGHLIMNYNDSANGNVEQFSICSNDSIWGDDEQQKQQQHVINNQTYQNVANANTMDDQDVDLDDDDDDEYGDDVDSHDYCTTINLAYVKSLGKIFKKMPINNNKIDYHETLDTMNVDRDSRMNKSQRMRVQEQCYQVTSTTNNNNINNTIVAVEDPIPDLNEKSLSTTTATIATNAKYKNHIMEKYLRGLDSVDAVDSNSNHHLELSKWLESAANFTPKKNNYIEWDGARRKPTTKLIGLTMNVSNICHHQKEEIEAAEALTCLAGNYRNRISNNCTK